MAFCAFGLNIFPQERPYNNVKIAPRKCKNMDKKIYILIVQFARLNLKNVPKSAKKNLRYTSVCLQLLETLVQGKFVFPLQPFSQHSTPSLVTDFFFLSIFLLAFILSSGHISVFLSNLPAIHPLLWSETCFRLHSSLSHLEICLRSIWRPHLSTAF